MPINNDHNFQKALESVSILKLVVQRKGILISILLNALASVKKESCPLLKLFLVLEGELAMDVTNYASTLRKKKPGQKSTWRAYFRHVDF